MNCVICGKYSSHTSDIDIEKFVVDNISYMFPVCQDSYDGRFTAHSDAQTQIEAIVRSETAKKKEKQEKLEAEQRKLIAKREADLKANQERVARDIEEKTYRIAMHNFHELTGGYNKRAMKEIYKQLKESAENDL